MGFKMSHKSNHNNAVKRIIGVADIHWDKIEFMKYI